MFGAKKILDHAQPMGGGGKGGGGGGTSTTNTVTKSDPWAGQQPYLTYGMQQAQQQYQQPGPEFYPGQTYAGYDPLQILAQQQALQYGGSSGTDIYNPALSAYQQMLTSPDLSTNPYLQPAISAAITPVTSQLLQDVLPSIRGQGIAAGQLGGTREGLAEAGAVSDWESTSGNIAAQMANQAYQSGLDQQYRALGMMPTLEQAGQLPISLTESVGAQNQAMNQQAINEAMQRYGYNAGLPAEKLAQYTNLISGNYGGQTSGSSTYPSPYYPSSLSSGLGGALTGYTLGNMIGAPQFLSSTMTTLGPIGAMVGLLSGLL